jgi:hypothetical protein
MKCDSGDMQDNYESTQLSGEDELEVSKKSSLTRPFFRSANHKHIADIGFSTMVS